MRERSGSQEPRETVIDKGSGGERRKGSEEEIERKLGIVRAMKTAANKCGTQWHKAN